MSSISYLLANLHPDRLSNVYTVGAQRGYGFYIQIPWHLRGTAHELMAQFAASDEVPETCLGFEFRDNGVQIERHQFPWRRSG